MIASLRGRLQSIETETAVLDVHGVGYELHCSSMTLADLSAASPGRETHVFVVTHVREDVIQLFGFSTAGEKQLFLSLNKVNGVGPKMAQKILSGTNLDSLLSMIEAEDVTGLSKLPKVGKKTAEQIILSLKGKLVRPVTAVEGHKKDIVSALVNLGFKLTDVEKVVATMATDTRLEDGVRLGLQALTSL
jgi:Holliday junction DNA helicase RuvA